MIRDLYELADEKARRVLIWLVVLATIAALCQAVAFVCLLPLLTAMTNGDQTSVQQWLTIIIIAAISHAVAALLAGTVGRATSAALFDVLLQRLGDQIGSLPLGYFDRFSAGKISEMATTGIAFAAAVPHVILRPIISGIVTPAVITLVMLIIDWRVGVVMVIAAPLIWWGFKQINSVTSVSDKEHTHAVSDVTTRLIEFTKNQIALRSAGQNSIVDRRVDEALHRQHEAFAQATATQGRAISRLGSIVQVTFATSIVVAVYLAVNQELSAAALLGILIVMSRFTEPIVSLGALSGGFSQGRNTLAELKQMLLIPQLSEPTEPEQPKDNSIEFRDVSFGYGDAPEKYVLKDVSFTAPKNSLIAIVGPSGCGKTTLMRLLSRFYDPQSGDIRIGGVSLPALGTRQVNALVTPVFQDTFLFDASIRENLTLAVPDATEFDINRAAHAAGVDTIVTELSDGWDSTVGEAGTLLSGGERQRVAIARALLKNSPIITLDEPTSSLDATTEASITKTIEMLRSEHTIIVIAHRLHTIRDADLIVVLDEYGSVAEIGTHDELMSTNGPYRQHWDKRQVRG